MNKIELVHWINSLIQHNNLKASYNSASRVSLTKDNFIAVCDMYHFNIHHKPKLKPQLNIERW